MTASMIPDNFTRCLAFTLTQEGGYQNISTDRGNWTGGEIGVGACLGTNFGISAASYPDLDIPNLTEADAATIYRRDYWAFINGDALPVGVAQVAFDWSVNSGAGTAARQLQALVGTSQDGVIGPQTIAALERHSVDSLITQLTGRRVSFYRALGTEWTEALVRRAVACQMAALAL